MCITKKINLQVGYTTIHQGKTLIEQFFYNLPQQIVANAIYVTYVQYSMRKFGRVEYTTDFMILFASVFFFMVGIKRDTAFYFQQLSTLIHLSIFLILFPLFSEPIVEIKARINISIASWFKGTPIPMACIAEQSDFEKEQLRVS